MRLRLILSRRRLAGMRRFTMRTPIIAGNWKMNKTQKEATALLEELKPLVADAACEVVVCVPFTNLATVK